MKQFFFTLILQVVWFQSVAVLLAGHCTYDSQVAGRGFESCLDINLQSGLRQATYTCVPLVTKQYNFLLVKGW